MTHKHKPWKPKHELPKMEDIDTTKMYAITLNPKNEYAGLPRTQYLQHKESLLDILTYKYHSICRLSLIPEGSPLSRFHWHGTVKIKKVLRFYLMVVRSLKKYFTIVIKPMDDKWLDEYCSKQFDLWEEELLPGDMPFTLPQKPPNNANMDLRNPYEQFTDDLDYGLSPTLMK